MNILNNKKILFVIIVILCVSNFLLLLGNNNDDKFILEDNKRSVKSYSSTISMMYETSAGSGEYEESTDNSWPQDGYIFNSTLSKCENGSNLSWNDETKNVIMKGNVSDRCYVYFEKEREYTSIIDACQNRNFASCIKKYYQVDGNIYHHKDLDNSAEDGSYRYSGTYNSVKNYVCFGTDAEDCPHDNKYRIIGVFGDNIKLIKADYAKSSELGTNYDYYGSYNPYWNISTVENLGRNEKTEIGIYYWNYNKGNSNLKNNWADSKLNIINLNETFLGLFDASWQKKINKSVWQVGGNIRDNIVYQNAAGVYQNEIINPATNLTYTAKIGLMYISDYGFAVSPSQWNATLGTYSNLKNYNWLYGGLLEWILTRNATDDSNVFMISEYGSINNYTVSNPYAIRPVFYLTSDVVLVSGAGSYDEPYKIA